MSRYWVAGMFTIAAAISTTTHLVSLWTSRGDCRHCSVQSAITTPRREEDPERARGVVTSYSILWNIMLALTLTFSIWGRKSSGSSSSGCCTRCVGCQGHWPGSARRAGPWWWCGRPQQPTACWPPVWLRWGPGSRQTHVTNTSKKLIKKYR